MGALMTNIILSYLDHPNFDRLSKIVNGIFRRFWFRIGFVDIIKKKSSLLIPYMNNGVQGLGPEYTPACICQNSTSNI